MPPRVPPRQWRVRLAFPAASFAGGRVLSGTSPRGSTAVSRTFTFGVIAGESGVKAQAYTTRTTAKVAPEGEITPGKGVESDPGRSRSYFLPRPVIFVRVQT